MKKFVQKLTYADGRVKEIRRDYDEMLEDAKLDAVIVETGADIHAEFCAKALEKNIKAFKEMPASEYTAFSGNCIKASCDAFSFSKQLGRFTEFLEA